MKPRGVGIASNRIGRRAALHVSALAALVAFTPSRPARADDAGAVSTFPLCLHRATLDDGAPVVSDDWIAAQLALANELFAPFGVAFAAVNASPPDVLAPALGRVETRDDRDRLAPLEQPGCINVFLVAALRDVDEADRYRMGVHWRLRANSARRYVIVSRIAAKGVLAHELGHYFGNGHSSVRNNVMSYLHDEGHAATFDAAQGARIRAEAKVVARELASPRR